MGSVSLSSFFFLVDFGGFGVFTFNGRFTPIMLLFWLHNFLTDLLPSSRLMQRLLAFSTLYLSNNSRMCVTPIASQYHIDVNGINGLAIDVHALAIDVKGINGLAIDVNGLAIDVKGINGLAIDVKGIIGLPIDVN